jgi:hypothetical protein
MLILPLDWVTLSTGSEADHHMDSPRGVQEQGRWTTLNHGIKGFTQSSYTCLRGQLSYRRFDRNVISEVGLVQECEKYILEGWQKEWRVVTWLRWEMIESGLVKCG